MTANPRSLAWIAARDPVETVLDGGPAKSDSLDANHKDLLLAEGGGARDLSADWVATDRALHFLRFNTGHAESWTWSDIQGAEIAKKGLISSTVRIRLRQGDPCMLTMGRRAAASLLAIVAEHADGGADHAG